MILVGEDVAVQIVYPKKHYGVYLTLVATICWSST